MNVQPASLANLQRFQAGKSGNPSGKPVHKPLTDKLKRRLDEILQPDTELAETVQRQLGGITLKNGTFLPRPIPKTWYGRTVADLMALVEIASALAGDGAAMARVYDRIEGKVDSGTGMTLLVQINSPHFAQDGTYAEPSEQAGTFDHTGHITIDVQPEVGNDST